MPEPTKAAIAVPSKDPKKKEIDEKNGAASKKKPDEKEGEELVRCIQSIAALELKLVYQSEEDLQLRGELEMLVERLKVRTSSYFRRL
jgi:26S proteasome regulatory subunit N1